MPDTDVLVVVAGPTGLLAAAELRRHGVDCRIIERDLERSPLSKALGVHARTLEVMDLIGIADWFEANGYVVPKLELHIDGRRPLEVPLDRLDTRFPYVLVLAQRGIEEILETHLWDLGGVVERGIEFVALAQEEDHVTADVRRAGDRIERIVARYLIAGDGAHSAVRHALGVPFIGEAEDVTISFADVRLSGWAAGRMHAFSARRGLGLLVPFREGWVRVVVVDLAKQDHPPIGELELADLQDSVDAIFPEPLVLSEPRWITSIRTSHRQVPSYRFGRVFLAGDAAHVHNPAGGQGMNLGLQDAFNLAWKLALVVRGDAPEDLLDTYDAERRPVGAQVIRGTARLVRMQAQQNPLLRAARNLIGAVALRLPPVQRRAALAVSGIGTGYGSRSGRRPLQAGARVPDVELLDGEGRRVRLYELLRTPGFARLIYADAGHLDETGRARLAELARSPVQSFVVLSDGSPHVLDVGAPALVDAQQQFRRKIGMRHGDALLVRPDGYAAMGGQSNESCWNAARSIPTDSTTPPRH